MDDWKSYNVSWRHGPAPGLTYYSGTEKVWAENEEEAGWQCKRDLQRKTCFSPGCITITKVETTG